MPHSNTTRIDRRVVLLLKHHLYTIIRDRFTHIKKFIVQLHAALSAAVIKHITLCLINTERGTPLKWNDFLDVVLYFVFWALWNDVGTLTFSGNIFKLESSFMIELKFVKNDYSTYKHWNLYNIARFFLNNKILWSI